MPLSRQLSTFEHCHSLKLSTDDLYSGEDVRAVWDVFDQQKLLGTGAFGTVYKAKSKGTSGTVVAVKMLPKNMVVPDEALAEFKMCARVSHPHIMRVFCFFDTSDAIFICSELASGGELNDYLVAHPSLNTESGIANVISQVIAALMYLHAERMVHHDIKPPNVLVTDQMWSLDPSGVTPLVVLGDFGTCQVYRALDSIAPRSYRACLLCSFTAAFAPCAHCSYAARRRASPHMLWQPVATAQIFRCSAR